MYKSFEVLICDIFFFVDDHDVMHFLTTSIHPPGQEPAGASKVSLEEQQRLAQEYQDYQKKLDQQKEEYQREHPESKKDKDKECNQETYAGDRCSWALK